MFSLAGVIAGLIGGLGYGLIGYAKNHEDGFNLKALLALVIPAGIVGGLSGYLGQDFSVVMSGTAGVAVTQFIKKLISLVWK